MKYRHLKRGTEYEVLFDDIELQCSETDLVDGSQMTVYRSLKDGKVWIRPYDEFHDKNRFEEVND